VESSRKILRKVVAIETEEGAGATVKRVFPTRHLSHFDPFALLDEFFVEPPASFPAHPHGGFEAITYMLEGGFHHKDNLGNDSIVLAGGAQKFTAGREIVHSELPGTKGLNRGLQLWVRLPSKLRDMEPDYQQIEPTNIPEDISRVARVRTIVGEGSPIKLHTKAEYLDVRLHPRSTFSRSIDPSLNMMLYVLEGTLSLSNSQIRRGEAALLTAGETVEAVAEDAARFALMAGKPHGEPVVLRGSFVY